MYQILLSERLDAETEARLERVAIIVRPGSLDEAELCRCVADCDAVIARSGTRITRAVIEAGRRLRVIGAASVGTDHIDVAAAAERGIKVINTPLANADAAAEFTVALMLQLLRPIPRLATAYAAGEFESLRREPHGPELRELTVGIVGMGRIGSRVGRVCAAGFGARVLYNDIALVGPFDFAAETVEKAAIWSQCDIVSLHVPLTEPTRKLVNAEVLRQFKPGAYLINTCRGPVVDTPALVEALDKGHIAGAALDVTEPEPLPPNHALRGFSNCTLTPHVAARTFGGLRRMYAVADEVIAFLTASPGHRL